MTEEVTKQQPQEEAVKDKANTQAETDQPKEADKAPEKQDKTSDSKKDQGRGGQFKGKRGGKGGRPGGRGRDRRGPKPDVPAESDYEEKNIEISRVTRVTKGGKRMRFRVLAVIGNHKGRVGFGMAKGVDVQSAMSKATNRARKSLLNVPIVNETIPHPVRIKHGAAEIVMKPAPKGTGVKAGGAVRTTLELAGIPNITAKILGTTNKVSNVKAVFEALSSLKAPEKKPKEEAKSQADTKEQDLKK
ncbi:30S ribosomal protein S5 [Candidatus Uhrbacteria bacterium]|nr:30S ribosomal protein S5 [Candidatus Uhrbacteria bacterium]